MEDALLKINKKTKSEKTTSIIRCFINPAVIRWIKYRLLLLFAVMLQFAPAQTTNQSQIKIIDLFAIPGMIIDSTTNAIDTTKVKLEIGFKLADFSALDRVYILLGSVVNQGDFMTLDMDVVTINGSYSLSWNGKNYPIIGSGYEVYFWLPLSSNQYKAIKHITVYAKENSGLETVRLNSSTGN